MSGMGHEGLAALGVGMVEGDYVVTPTTAIVDYVLGRGVESRALALDYFAKRKGQSHGRQMPSHYSYASRGVWSVPTPTGSQLLPACGIAWGIQLDKKPNVVVTTIGDAATRQGDFFEAVCFAKERKLPVLFVVEDNKYGISSPTRKINPRAPRRSSALKTGGKSMEAMFNRSTTRGRRRIRVDAVRGRTGIFLGENMERLSSHTSSDDHKLYLAKAAEEGLAEGEKCDPLKRAGARS